MNAALFYLGGALSNCPLCVVIDSGGDSADFETGVLAGWVAATIAPHIEGWALCVAHADLVGNTAKLLDIKALVRASASKGAVR